MNNALWVLQIFLGVVFLVTGATKLFVPHAKLAERMGWAKEFATWQVKALGLAEVFGAFGLVLPRWMGVARALVPVAAVCLAFLMGGAASVHLRRSEPASPPIILAVLSLFVAAARFARAVP